MHDRALDGDIVVCSDRYGARGTIVLNLARIRAIVLDDHSACDSSSVAVGVNDDITASGDNLAGDCNIAAVKGNALSRRDLVAGSYLNVAARAIRGDGNGRELGIDIAENNRLGGDVYRVACSSRNLACEDTVGVLQVDLTDNTVRIEREGLVSRSCELGVHIDVAARDTGGLYRGIALHIKCTRRAGADDIAALRLEGAGLGRVHGLDNALEDKILRIDCRRIDGYGQLVGGNITEREACCVSDSHIADLLGGVVTLHCADLVGALEVEVLEGGRVAVAREREVGCGDLRRRVLSSSTPKGHIAVGGAVRDIEITLKINRSIGLGGGRVGIVSAKEDTLSGNRISDF